MLKVSAFYIEKQKSFNPKRYFLVRCQYQNKKALFTDTIFSEGFEFRDKYTTEESKLGRKHEEKLKAAMEALDTKWKDSQSRVQDWKEKYEKEKDVHEQTKYFQKLYESQAKSLLELHHLHQLDQCGPWCTGKSLSEALLFAEHGENMLCT